MLDSISSWAQNNDQPKLKKALNLSKEHPIFNGKYHSIDSVKNKKNTAIEKNATVFAKLKNDSVQVKINRNETEKSYADLFNDPEFKPEQRKKLNLSVNKELPFKVANKRNKTSRSHPSTPQKKNNQHTTPQKENSQHTQKQPNKSLEKNFDSMKYLASAGGSAYKGFRSKSPLAAKDRYGEISMAYDLYNDFSTPGWSNKEKFDITALSVAGGAGIHKSINTAKKLTKESDSGLKKIAKEASKTGWTKFMKVLGDIFFLDQLSEDAQEGYNDYKKGVPLIKTLTSYKAIRDMTAIAFGAMQGLAVGLAIGGPPGAVAGLIAGLAMAGDVSLIMDIANDTMEFLSSISTIHPNRQPYNIKKPMVHQPDALRVKPIQKIEPLRQPIPRREMPTLKNLASLTPLNKQLKRTTPLHTSPRQKAGHTQKDLHNKNSQTPVNVTNQINVTGGNYDIKSIAETIMKGINDKLRDSVVAYG